MKQIIIFLFTGVVFSSAAQSTLTLQPGSAAGKDASVFSCISCGFDVTNYGNFPELDAIAWTNNGDSSNARGLLQFDLTGINPGSTIIDARLSLYYNPTSYNTGHSTLSGSNAFLIQRVTSNWIENTVTWDNQPTTTSVNEVLLPQSTYTNQDYLNIDVKSLVQTMVNMPSQNFGFMIRLQTELPYRSILFATSDHADSTRHPKLVITYAGPDGVPDMQAEKNNITLYPNPASRNVTVFLKKSELSKIEIFDPLGKQIAGFENVNSEKLDIDLQNLNKGIYFVNIESDDKTCVKKLIVE